MTPTELELFNRAVGLARAGQSQEAYAQFKRLAFTNPDETNLLLWIAATSPYEQEIQSIVQRVGGKGKDLSSSSHQVHSWKGIKSNSFSVKEVVLIMFLAALVVVGILTLLGPQIGYIGEPPSKPRLKAISCPSATTCYAVGEAIMATKDGGKTWVIQEARLTNLLEDISCPDTETCWAVGSKGTIRLITNGGKDWAYYNTGNFDRPQKISCPELKVCFVAAFAYSD